jgi:hypothetical protein
MLRSRHIFLLLVSAVLTSCANVPHQAAELSGELGGMIRESRATHLALVDEYINERRRRVDDFMSRDWIPKFTKNFITEAKLDQELAAAKTSEEKVQIHQEFQEAATQRVSERRALLMNAVDEVGRLLRARIDEHYDQMGLVNQTLTAHLRSAEKVNATRDELLKLAKIRPNQLIPFAQLDQIVGKMERFEGSVDALRGLATQAKDILVPGGRDGK